MLVMFPYADGKHVEYKGEIMSLNVYGCKVIELNVIQSYAFIRKVDDEKTLSELREDKMKELGMIK